MVVVNTRACSLPARDTGATLTNVTDVTDGRALRRRIRDLSPLYGTFQTPILES